MEKKKIRVRQGGPKVFINKKNTSTLYMQLLRKSQ